MRRQSGYSLVELTVTTAIIAMMVSLVTVSGASLNGYMKLSRSVAQLADSISQARLEASSRYESRMIEVPVPPMGTLVVDHVVVRVCDRSRNACNPYNPTEWSSPGELVPAGDGMGFVFPEDPPADPYRIVFTEIGAVTARSFITDIRVCPVYRDATNLLQCRQGAPAKTVRIRAVTGIVQVL